PSSNVPFPNLPKQKLPFTPYQQYLHNFHFYHKTPIHFPNHPTTKINYTYQYHKPSTPYPQPSPITPIQQIETPTPIPNPPTMMNPYL
ncbi:penicillin-binding transpeptidase domain-containing protein, partial [Bacillus pumilus]|uniref:penicillin-binding transpeptidase domain-containing protein n=1 Tax=Bacillus pumilus TaxID=1408 RepID=UPI003703AD23